MPRRRRVQPTDAPLHIIGRGVRGEPVLGDTAGKRHFLHRLEEVRFSFGWKVLNWVLMTNHYHLVIRLSEPTLAAGMQRLHGMVAQTWNWRHQEMGHVWMRRYSSIPILDERQFGSVMRYIDLNPVRAGLCAHPADWPWSGYAANVGLRPPIPGHSPVDFAAMQIRREDYAALIHAEAPRVHGIGGLFDERPTLHEIIDRDDITTIDDAILLWGYRVGEVALFMGVTRQGLLKRRSATRAHRSST